MGITQGQRRRTDPARSPVHTPHTDTADARLALALSQVLPGLGSDNANKPLPSAWKKKLGHATPEQLQAIIVEATVRLYQQSRTPHPPLHANHF